MVFESRREGFVGWVLLSDVDSWFVVVVRQAQA